MLESIGLGGDGDEVDAIRRVEARFGILFDYEDCERFVTVGQVWRALLKELGRSDAQAVHLWPELVRELGEETLREAEVDQIGLETRLIV